MALSEGCLKMENTEPQIKREVAVKVKIKNIIDGRYVKEEGWKPNYITTLYGENITRANIMAVVVSDPAVEEKSQSLTIDDGSARLQLRSFQDGVDLSGFVLGDVVNVIGKPKEYAGFKYLIPEVMKIIKNNKWLEVRKKELELKEKGRENIATIQNSTTTQQEEKAVEEESVHEENKTEKIIRLAKEMDAGNGVFIEDIVERLQDRETDKIISTLLEQGDIFEIQPGKIKVLE
jgi:RPA family protein